MNQAVTRIGVEEQTRDVSMRVNRMRENLEVASDAVDILEKRLAWICSDAGNDAPAIVEKDGQKVSMGPMCGLSEVLADLDSRVISISRRITFLNDHVQI